MKKLVYEVRRGMEFDKVDTYAQLQEKLAAGFRLDREVYIDIPEPKETKTGAEYLYQLRRIAAGMYKPYKPTWAARVK